MMLKLIAYLLLIQSAVASRNTLVRNTIHSQKNGCGGHHGNIERVWNQFSLSDVIKAPELQARVRFGSEELRTMGQIFTPSKVKMEPTVTWPCSCNKLYSVFMIDPDAPSRRDPTAGQWYHWGVVNVPGNDVSKGDVVTEYSGPTPPKATGLHRYVILVFEQEKEIPMTGITKIGNTPKNRSKRDIKRIAKEFGITPEPLAGACFQAKWENALPFIPRKMK